jgi:nucleoside-diphosphate-sugar epimerase
MSIGLFMTTRRRVLTTVWGAGFIGANLVRRLLGDGSHFAIAVINSLSPGHENKPGACIRSSLTSGRSRWR